MNVPVTLRERKADGHVDKRALSVPVDPDEDTVADVLEKVSTLCGIPDSRLQLILGGSRLQPETSVLQLQLGPLTSLLALVAETNCQSLRATSISLTESEITSRKGLSSFFVYCKSCKDVKAAKLRVHCSACDSTSIQVQREPEQWKDVLRSERIPSECFECDSPATVWARFVFKCTQCNEPSAALQHLRPPVAASAAAAASTSTASALPMATSCCICFSSLDQETCSSPIMDLRCGHLLCLQCFASYIKSGLKSEQFSLHPRHGYTIGCPWPTCKAIVKDPHHFAVAGHDTYSEYKSAAVDAFVASDAVKCALCAVAFIWDAPCEREADGSTEEERGERRMIECPHCSKQFCAACRREPCTCEDEEAANRLLFEATTRMCPRCDARTERSGGCAHITCTSCGNHWCFVCVGPWTEECQWNHWFS